MKTIIKISFALFAIAVIAVACTNKQGAVPNASLTGKWRYIGSRMSSGGPQYFVPATNSNGYLQLNADASMYWKLPDNSTGSYVKYTVLDSVKLKLSSADGKEYEDYYYKIKGDSLSLGMAGPIVCYEGCSEHFVKVK
ncbi:hypothetical protein [Mucilaginibacter gilvus]|uniref:Lipocalin-like domain-containing protein n=1 Tax=Mucilaginibacter gilvus TaxID=2305909 RepID=A0A444MIK0_9SPHI|nr:hypothetical protein [Mucilaginibacter gilvus]RWY47965.1 hypothetical protein EPL05_20455 [Mucilaginibacter gilvus]